MNKNNKYVSKQYNNLHQAIETILTYNIKVTCKVNAIN